MGRKAFPASGSMTGKGRLDDMNQMSEYDNDIGHRHLRRISTTSDNSQSCLNTSGMTITTVSSDISLDENNDVDSSSVMKLMFEQRPEDDTISTRHRSSLNQRHKNSINNKTVSSSRRPQRSYFIGMILGLTFIQLASLVFRTDQIFTAVLPSSSSSSSGWNILTHRSMMTTMMDTAAAFIMPMYSSNSSTVGFISSNKLEVESDESDDEENEEGSTILFDPAFASVTTTDDDKTNEEILPSRQHQSMSVISLEKQSNVTINPNLNPKDDYVDDTERVLFLISMGQNARKSRIVERFVYSSRTRGKYNGWIVLLSDAPKSRYKELNAWTDRLIHIQPNPQHLNPPSHNFSLPSMGYKRLKTYVLEYVATDRRLDNVQHVYYLDVDIVFGDSVWPMFHGLEPEYGITTGVSPVSSKLTTSAKGLMWMFHGNTPKWKIQGGQIFLHRQHSQPCLERWRYLIDSASMHARKDQDMLMEMLQDQNTAIYDKKDLSTLECEVVIMKQKPFIEFPKPQAIRKRAKQLKLAASSSSALTNETSTVAPTAAPTEVPETTSSKSKRKKRKKSSTSSNKDDDLTYYYAPLVHLRNDGGTKRIKPHVIKEYIQDVCNKSYNIFLAVT